MAGWLFQKAPTVSRLKRFLGKGKPAPSGRTMILQGSKWAMRWFVLDATVEQAYDARRVEQVKDGAMASSRDVRLASYETELGDGGGMLMSLGGINKIPLLPRETEAGTIHGNFALDYGEGRLEFAARSEEEAREWVKALENALLTPTNASTVSVVKV